MLYIDEIPTAPNSPAEPFTHTTHSLSPAPSIELDWSEVDMMSSIESISRQATQSPRMTSHEGIEKPNSIETAPPVPRLPPPSTSSHVEHAAHAASLSPSLCSSSSSTSNHGFVMPSLPKPLYESGRELENHQPVVGLLHIAVAGSSGRAVLRSFASEMHEQHAVIKRDGMETRICSSSMFEHGNIELIDANFVPKDVPKWMESRLQRNAPVDMIVYTLAESGPSQEDLAAMSEIQKLAELVVVVAKRGKTTSKNNESNETHDDEDDTEDDSDEIGTTQSTGTIESPRNLASAESLLRINDLAGFQKRVWRVNTRFKRNWEMSASTVQAPNYSSFVPSQHDSDLKPLVAAVLRSSGRIRATAEMLRSRWFQSQLVVTTAEPPGTLAHHVNLRRKTLESIGNLDPLGIAHWSVVPKLATVLFAGLLSGALAAVGASSVCSRILVGTGGCAPPPAKRHALFDMENWPEWLV